MSRATRSRVDLSDVDVKELLLEKERVASEGNALDVSKDAVAPSKAVPSEDCKPSRFLILDTESFNFRVYNDPDEREMVLPLEIAWGVYEWTDQNELRLTKTFHCYLAELACLSHYKDQLKEFSRRTFEKHERNLNDHHFPLTTVINCLEELYFDVLTVDAIVAYNVSWDFNAIGNLLRVFYPETAQPVRMPSGCPVIDEYDGFADNPFNLMRVPYLDLMHMLIKRYGEQLVHRGIKDGSVHKSRTSEKLFLKKRNAKSIYSAEYAIRAFFGVDQKHLADEDVVCEAMMLEKILRDFGLNCLEYNIIYPLKSTYKRMIHMATSIYEMTHPPQNDKPPAEPRKFHRRPPTECLFRQDDLE